MRRREPSSVKSRREGSPLPTCGNDDQYTFGLDLILIHEQYAEAASYKMQIRFKRIATSKKSAVAQKQGRGGCRLVKMTVRESMTREESVSGLLKKKFYLLPSHHFRFLFLVYPRILSWFSFRHFAIYFINFFRFFR